MQTPEEAAQEFCLAKPAGTSTYEALVVLLRERDAELLSTVAKRLREPGRLWHGMDSVSVMWNAPYSRTTPLIDWLRNGAPPFDDSDEAGLADLQKRVAEARNPSTKGKTDESA